MSASHGDYRPYSDLPVEASDEDYRYTEWLARAADAATLMAFAVCAIAFCVWKGWL